MILREIVQPPQGLNEMLASLEVFKNIDLSSLPNIENIFKNREQIATVLASAPHVDLYSSANLYNGQEPRINSVNYQFIKESDDPNRGVRKHNHASSGPNGVGQHEIIITQGEPGYANLPKTNVYKLGEYVITVVPAGVDHGDNSNISTGYWVSIKVSI